MALHFNVGLLKDTFKNFNEDKAPRLAASLSYSTIFAIAPVIVIVIAIAGTIIAETVGHGHGHGGVRDQLLAGIRASAGKEAADTVAQMVNTTFNKPRQSLIAQVIGWITLVLGAAGLFAALQDAINTVWHATAPKKGILPMIRDRVASLGMLLAIGFLLLVTTAANATITFVSTKVTSMLPFPGAGTLFQVVNIVVELALIALLFALMYKFLPDTEVAWNDVWTGAIVTAVLFVVGQSLIGLYISKAGVASGYGAAGSILVLLVWIYYSSMILLFGASFTRVYAEQHGSRVGAPEAPPADTSGQPKAVAQDDGTAAAKPQVPPEPRPAGRKL